MNGIALFTISLLQYVNLRFIKILPIFPLSGVESLKINRVLRKIICPIFMVF